MSDKKPVHMASGGRLGGSRNSRFKFESSQEPYPKWGKDNSSTVPNDPANEVNRAKGDPQKAAPGVTFHSNNTQTVNDGTTDALMSHMNKAAPELGQLGTEKQHYPPCINPNCKSFGKSHPNCLCYAGPGGSSLEQGYFASGGCVGPHKEDCEHFADGGQVQEQQQFLNNPTGALDHVGVNNGLLHLLTKTGYNGRSDNPHKHIEDFSDHAKKGRKSVDSHISKLLTPDKIDAIPDKDGVAALKNHLDSLQQDPEKALDVGGEMGSVLPDHAAALGAKTGNALNYFQALKPKASALNPLDRSPSASKGDTAAYDRQLAIAQNPMLILKHAQKGTIHPQDLKTLHTLYPSLGQSLTGKAGEALIDAKMKGVELPYQQKRGLSALLGQPLDSSMSPSIMQQIMKANAPAQQQQPQGKSKGTTASTQKAIEKDTNISATPTQKRQLDQKS
jgi:hypothetical protein